MILRKKAIGIAVVQGDGNRRVNGREATVHNTRSGQSLAAR